jgi:hypothetical protein
MTEKSDKSGAQLPYIGKIGEYRVLAALLEQGIEAYPAIRSNQEDYDITAIPRNDRVVRIQVKTTELNNRSTNNAISGTDKKFDFLVLVVVTDTKDKHRGVLARYFLLTHDEVTSLRGEDKLLGVSCKKNGAYEIREALMVHEDKWEKLRDA